MDSFVDLFILVESDLTFQGEPKELYYENNKSRFKKWNHKILTINPILPETNNPWLREHLSRECLKETFRDFSPNTIIIHGDVDEIVSSKLGNNLKFIITDKSVYTLDQKLYSMAVDWLYPLDWQGTTIAIKSTVDTMSITDLRNKRVTGKKIRDGWHFTWLGGKEFIDKKAKSFSHTEDEIQSYIKDMGIRLYTEGYHVRGEKLIPVDIDDSYPIYITNRLCPDEWFRPR